MAETYTYPITAFANDAVFITNLEDEIEKNITTSVVETTSHDGQVHITFTQALTGTEQSDLDAIVTAHDGIPYDYFKVISTERIDTFTSTSSAYTQVLSLSASNIAPGDYRLLWSMIYGIDSGLVNFRMRIQQNDTVTKTEHVEEVPSADPDERIPRSGFLPITLTPGDYHWDIECGKETGGEEAWKVFKAFLELRRLN